MTVFILICQFVILLMLLSMIYSQAQIERETRAKMTQLAQTYSLLEQKILKLEYQIMELKNNKEVSEDDNSGSKRNRDTIQ